MYKRQELHEGDHVKVYVVEVAATDRGPRVMLSRTHPGLVKRLFEMEVPELYDGTVELKAISREAGSRTKIAVYSKDQNVDAVGACIGPKGAPVSYTHLDVYKRQDQNTAGVQLQPFFKVPAVIIKSGFFRNKQQRLSLIHI